jgi:hypothetical protein
VHAGAVSMLQHLASTGHAVTLEDGVVSVEPLDDLSEEQLYLLEAFEEDLALLLAGGGLTVH